MITNILKKEKYSIIAAVIAFLLTFTVCRAIFLPRNIGNVLEPVGYPVENLAISQIDSLLDCTVEASGKYTITGADPQIIFSCEGKEIECVEIAFEQTTAEVSVEVFTAYEDGKFSAERCYAGRTLEDESTVIIDLPKGSYSFLRIDINTDSVYFKNVGLYETQPKAVPFDAERTLGDYFKTIVIPLAIAFIVRTIDKRTGFTRAAVETIVKNKLKIAEFVVFTIVAILSGVLIEKITSIILPGDFNKYRFVFFAGIAELIVIFIRGRKDLKDHPEKLFLPITLVLGLVMLFGSPIRHIAWDIDSHYPWAVGMSYFDTAYYTEADHEIDLNGAGELVGPFTELSKEKYDQRLSTLTEMDEIIAKKSDAEFSLAHIPAGIFIAVARYFGADFELKYNLGRLAYLLVYAFVCYFAIKKIKSGKMILATICLIPTNIFMTTNYGYDYWLIAFSILGMSYYVSMLQEPKKIISFSDTIIMCSAFALASMPKLVYVPFLAIPLFMPREWNNKKEIRKYYSIIIAFFAIVFALFMLKSMSSVGGTGDLRGGNVNPSAQIKGIFGDLFGYFKILVKFLMKYLSFGGMKEYISNFAYLGMGKCWIAIVILLVFTTLTDTNKTNFKTPIYIRILSVIFFVSMAALIATALYISFTPLAAETINGCQPRYLIPLLSPLLLLVTGRRLNLFKNKKVYNGCVLGIMSTLVMIETYTQIIKVML